MDTAKATEQIRKLLNLAADDAAGLTFEAENALAFARRLMLKHNINEAELGKAKSAHEQAADEQYDAETTYSTFTRIMPWENALATAVAGLLGTVGVYVAGQKTKRTASGTVDFDSKGKEQMRTGIVFYGPEADARDACDLLDEWRHVIFAMARLRFGQAIRGDGRAYAAGFAQALCDKVEWMRGKEKNAIATSNPKMVEGTGAKTALALTQGLALISAKRERATRWLEEEKGIKLRSRSATGPGFGAGAYGAGKADGQKADFSHTKTKKLGG